MAVSYPDVIGEHVATRERYATGGLQYVGYFNPATIAPGQISNLFLFLQNMLDVPMTVNFKVNVPQTGFLRGGKPMLEVGTREFEIRLAAAEAGLLTLPVTTTDHTKPAEHPLTAEIRVNTKSKGQRVRPKESNSNLERRLIDDPIGLNLVSSLGATYKEKSTKKAQFTLGVAGDPAPSALSSVLKHSYETIWTQKDAKIYNDAVREINSRQVNLKKDLEIETLYVNLYGESVARFADAGLPLRIGEAIILGKILTYSCQYFLSSQKRNAGLLIPIWERAYELEFDTTDALSVIRSVGYHHLLRIAVAMSFGLIGRAVGRQYWSLEERQGVASHIADSIEVGDTLDADFLYLPLIMAGTFICNKLTLPGEDVKHTLALVKQARQSRTKLFTEGDMAQANKIYNNILKKAIPDA